MNQVPICFYLLGYQVIRLLCDYFEAGSLHRRKKKVLIRYRFLLFYLLRYQVIRLLCAIWRPDHYTQCLNLVPISFINYQVIRLLGDNLDVGPKKRKEALIYIPISLYQVIILLGYYVSIWISEDHKKEGLLQVPILFITIRILCDNLKIGPQHSRKRALYLEVGPS